VVPPVVPVVGRGQPMEIIGTASSLTVRQSWADRAPVLVIGHGHAAFNAVSKPSNRTAFARFPPGWRANYATNPSHRDLRRPDRDPGDHTGIRYRRDRGVPDA